MSFTQSHIKAVLGLFLFAFFLIPSLAQAQPTGQSLQAAQQARTYVLSQVGDPLNVTGLNYCNDTNFLIARTDGETCGGVAEVNGSLTAWSSVTFSRNDIVKCYWPPVAGPSCVVTNAARTQQRFYSDTWLGGSEAVVADMAGNISGYSEQGLVEDTIETVVPSVIELFGEIAGNIISGVAWVVLTLATMLLAMAGTLFNWVVVKTVFGFSVFLGNSPGLLIAWGILRDVGNMLLLFGFIFLGLTVILNLHPYPAKKTIPRLIIFAILMNFSLFAAEAVIDTSNVLSSVMYTQANTDSCDSDKDGRSDYDEDAQTVGSDAGIANLTSDENCFLATGIAGKIMEVSGTSGIFDTGPNTYSNPVVLIMLALFATVAAVVLFAGAIMLLIRAVTLTFLMVLAPLGFAALAIPGLQKRGEEWWSKLIHQSFFAPIYLLLIFISLKIGEAVTGGSGASLAAAVAQPHSSTMGIILSFGLVIGFLIASLVMAKKFGAMGASFAINTATGFTSRVMGGAVLGGAGWAGRKTLGLGSDKVARMVESSKWAQKRPNLARMAVKPFDKVKGASFDARMTKAVQSGAKAIGNGTDFGKPGKDAQKGYRGTIDAKVKARDEFEKRLKPTDEQKGIGEELGKELDDLQKAQREHLAPQLEAVEKQRLKVAEARLKGDKDALKVERDILRTKIKEYDDARAREDNPYNKVVGYETDKDGNPTDVPIRLGKQLEERTKEWRKRGEQEKTRIYVDEGLENRWYNHFPLTPSALANEEARNKIRKDRSTDVLEKALKKIAAGDTGTPPPPPPPAGP